LAVKWLLKIPPLFAYVATLPCEILMSEAVGSLITKLKSFVAESVSNKYIRQIFGKVTWLSREFFRLLAVWWPGTKSARKNHLLAKYLQNFFSLTALAVNLS